MIAGGVFFAYDQHLVGSTMQTIDGAAAIVPCAALWARRRHPLAVGWLAVGFSSFSGASRGSGAGRAVHGRGPLPAAAHPATGAAVRPGGCTYSAIYNNGAFAFGSLAFWLVMTRRGRRGSACSCGRGASCCCRCRSGRSGAEDEQHLRVREAQLAERARIAREMHDVLAHRISLLSVHAGALEFNPAASPEEIARAAGVIRVSARAAQEELREVIGVLRAGAETRDAEPPQPTLADLATLVGESRAAGMDVTLDNAIEGEALPPILGRTSTGWSRRR